MSRSTGPVGGPRCLVICQWFPPEPTILPVDIADMLERAGFETIVLTGLPNYPHGTLADGYPMRNRAEINHGHRVLRVLEYPSHSSSAVGRMANYLSFAIAATVFGSRLVRGSDVTFVYGSPVTAALPAYVDSLVRGTPYVVHVQDVWPDSIYATGFAGRAGRLVRPVLESVCTAIYRRADAVIAISDGMGDLLVSRGVERERVWSIYNWDARDSTDRYDPARNSENLRLIYAGNFGAAQNLGPLVEAVGRLEGVSLTLVGGGVEEDRLRALVAANGYQNIEFRASMSRSEVSRFARDFDTHIVSLQRQELFRVTIPGKFQSILAAGFPVLSIVDGEVSRIVEENDLGWTAVPGDVASITTAIEVARRSARPERRAMGERARRYYDQHMTRESAASRIGSLMRRVVAAAPRRRRSGR